MISHELQQAIDCLQIQDVYLRDFVARCVEGFEPKYSAVDQLTFQARHFVKKSEVVDLENDKQLLRVYVDLGARWVDALIEDEDAAIKAFVEAEFIAEYAMTEPLEQTCIDAFALHNASYHVWPYWRELLNSQSARMHLPKAVLPTVQLAQNRNGEREG